MSDTPDMIIDLEQIAEPYGVVRVGADETYPLRQFDSFSYFEQRALAREWNRIVAIEIAEEVSEDDAKEYERIGRDIFGRLCEMPKKKAGALSTTQVMDVCGRFFGVQLKRGRIRTPSLMGLLNGLRTSEPLPSDSTPDGPDQEVPKSG